MDSLLNTKFKETNSRLDTKMNDNIGNINAFNINQFDNEELSLPRGNMISVILFSNSGLNHQRTPARERANDIAISGPRRVVIHAFPELCFRYF